MSDKTTLEDALKAWQAQYGDGTKPCPSPRRHSQDEFRCNGCSMIWGIDETRPACPIFESKVKP